MGFLQILVKTIDGINEQIGRAVAWLALFMVLTQFVVVVMRYVFGLSVLVMQESIWFMHSIIFLVAGGYTLLHNGHVRVDILYGNVNERKKAIIDIIGVLAILLPVCVATWWVSWEYVANAWAIKEGSIEVSGIQGVYLLKSCILLFAGLIALQGISLLIKSCWIVAGRADLARTVDDPQEHGL
ncbi:MAG: TRAP transporter small permease subunit [Chromatiales bacterium]|mgnify:CR=1 FL=1|jgi:TRAP-type mannitol/chloroaromatic compound transport system permease small subunit|nr:TRAP transporter small permease subunit [Chromatiales bacterium]